MSGRITLCLFLLSVIIQPQVKAIEKSNNGSFSSVLFDLVSNGNENKNVIISPFSIQSALTLLYMGAEGETAKEFKQVLQYSSPNKTETADHFARILSSTTSNELLQLKTANRIYTNTKFSIVPKFNEIALKYFQSEAEVVDFKLRDQTATKINNWVEEKTNNRIKNLINPKAIDGQTAAILVNAIYFKAQWADQFDKENTKKQPFYISETESIDVDTMSGEITCKYGSFSDLDASAIELRYDESDVVMDVIVPNKRDGLKDLERKLTLVDLGLRFANITEDEVKVELPKFKIEFEISLIPVLEEMGLKMAFMFGANFDGMINTIQPLKVSDVIHKAFIEVNELGSEAAAATYSKIQFLILNAPQTFTADHPFVFVIRNPEAIFFIGHISHFNN